MIPLDDRDLTAMRVLAAKYVLGVAIDDWLSSPEFASVGDHYGDFFENVIREAAEADEGLLPEEAFRLFGIELPTRGEAAVIMATDYSRRALVHGKLDLYKITEDLYPLVHEAQTDDEKGALNFLHIAQEATNYPKDSDAYCKYQQECEASMRNLPPILLKNP